MTYVKVDSTTRVILSKISSVDDREMGYVIFPLVIYNMHSIREELG